MIIYIYGPDTFRSRQYLKKTVEQFKKQRDPQGYNVVFLNGAKETAGKILSELSAAPFLAERRMIVIENILSSTDKDLLGEIIERMKSEVANTPRVPPCGGGVDKSPHAGGLGGVLVEAGTRAPNPNIIVFWQEDALSKVKEAKELSELLAKGKYAQEFKFLAESELMKWAEKEIAVRGGKIEPLALRYLCQNCGQDMWLVNTLIDQLVAYTSESLPPPPSAPPSATSADRPAGGEATPSSPLEGDVKGEVGRPITLADVQLFLNEKVDENIFNMVDAVVSGNRQQAFKLLQRQRNLGMEEGRIFGMILRQIRIMVEMRDLFNREEHATSDVLAKELSLHPFVVRKSLPMVRKFSLEKLTAAHKKLLDIDFKTKTGQGNLSLLIDLFTSQF